MRFCEVGEKTCELTSQRFAIAKLFYQYNKVLATCQLVLILKKTINEERSYQVFGLLI